MRMLEDNLTKLPLKRACPHGPTILLLEFTLKKHLLCRGYQFPPYVFPTAYVVTQSLAARVRLHFPAAHEAKCWPCDQGPASRMWEETAVFRTCSPRGVVCPRFLLCRLSAGWNADMGWFISDHAREDHTLGTQTRKKVLRDSISPRLFTFILLYERKRCFCFVPLLWCLLNLNSN